MLSSDLIGPPHAANTLDSNTCEGGRCLRQILLDSRRMHSAEIYLQGMASKRKPPKSSVHYVLAAYLGPRRVEYPPQKADRLHFLREHMASLSGLAHELGQITVVIATEDEASARVEWGRQLAGVIPAKVRKNTPVSTLWVKNSVGLSYASLVAAATPDFYDYTIFTEDDYIFTVDHFDRFLVDEIERTQASWVCGAAWPHPEMPCHAAVASGIMRSSLLKGVTIAEYPQLELSREMLKHGPIVDWLGTYATAFKTDSHELRWIGDKDRALLIPVQLIGTHVTPDGHRIL